MWLKHKFLGHWLVVGVPQAQAAVAAFSTCLHRTISRYWKCTVLACLNLNDKNGKLKIILRVIIIIALFSCVQLYHLSITEALSQLWQQDFLQSPLCQLMAAVAAPHIHHDRVTLWTRSSRISAAGAQAVGCQVTNLSKGGKKRSIKPIAGNISVAWMVLQCVPPQTGTALPGRVGKVHLHPFSAPEYWQNPLGNPVRGGGGEIYN